MSALLLHVVIAGLALIGLAVSVRMQVKVRSAERGLLTEPSVVQTPRARLFGDTPNSLLGIIYYALVAVGVWLIHITPVWLVLVMAAAAAALVSIILAYSLLFITRMPCVMCWTGHAVNWLLLVALFAARPR